MRSWILILQKLQKYRVLRKTRTQVIMVPYKIALSDLSNIRSQKYFYTDLFYFTVHYFLNKVKPKIIRRILQMAVPYSVLIVAESHVSEHSTYPRVDQRHSVLEKEVAESFCPLLRQIRADYRRKLEQIFEVRRVKIAHNKVALYRGIEFLKCHRLMKNRILSF